MRFPTAPLLALTTVLTTILTTVLTMALTMALTGGCASDGRGSVETEAAHHGIAREHAYTRMLEVRVVDDITIVAYLVEFEDLPIGVIDERPFPIGTALVQDVKLNTVGFLTPGGEAFRFDDDGASHSLGHGSRHELVARVLGTSAHVRFRVVGGSR
jgi:hypothetical protein